MLLSDKIFDFVMPSRYGTEKMFQEMCSSLNQK